MRKVLLCCFLLLPFLLPTLSYASAPTVGYFVTTWDTTKSGASVGNQIQFAIDCSTPTCAVYWEDVGNATIYGTTTVSTGSNFITFPSPGTYRVDMSGNITAFTSPDDNHKILTVEQWGSPIWTTTASMFYLSDNVHIKATDQPNLSQVTNMSFMFAEGPIIDTSISNWDVSHVTNMANLFSRNTTFNQPLNNWNVTNVTDMSNMFYHAHSFNQPLGNWNVANVTNMSYMFAFDPVFNQPLSSWSTASLNSILGMFNGATVFNQSLSNFNVSQVTNFAAVFNNATAFNQPLNTWNVANATSFSAMFQGAAAFNQPLNSWATSQVADLGYTFEGATNFNQDISSWDYSAVTYFYSFLENTELSGTYGDALLQKWASSTLNTNLNTNVGLKNFGAAAETNRLLVQTRNSWVISYQVVATYTAGTHATLIGDGRQKMQPGQSTASVEVVPDTGCTFMHWSDENPLTTSIGTIRSDTLGTDNLAVSAIIECTDTTTTSLNRHHTITSTLVLIATTTPNRFLWDGIQPFTSNPASTTDPIALRALVILMTQLLTAFTQLATALKS